MAANEGAFDDIPVSAVKPAQETLLSRLHQQYRKEMTELDKGDKPTDKTSELIVKVAKEIAKEYKG